MQSTMFLPQFSSMSGANIKLNKHRRNEVDDGKGVMFISHSVSVIHPW